MKLSVMVEVQAGLTWSRWSELTATAERLGFAGIFLSDHFGDGDRDTIETVTALTHLASHSESIRFGTLVSPLSFRDPIMLARQAVAINNLSRGRMVLGIGAGWEDGEHSRFGYTLGDVNTRMDRLEEGAHLIHELLHTDVPITFEGRFFRVQNGLLPRAQQAIPLMIGGSGPKRTLPIVAKYADIWNSLADSATLFKERSMMLDELIQAAGRKPSDVKRSVFMPVCCWRDSEEKEEALAFMKKSSRFSGKSSDEVFDLLTKEAWIIMGSPDSIVEQLNMYREAGAEEFMMMSVTGSERPDYLEKLASHVLPYFATNHP